MANAGGVLTLLCASLSTLSIRRSEKLRRVFAFRLASDTAEHPTHGMLTPQLIHNQGYVAESHSVATKDGFIIGTALPCQC